MRNDIVPDGVDFVDRLFERMEGLLSFFTTAILHRPLCLVAAIRTLEGREKEMGEFALSKHLRQCGTSMYGLACSGPQPRWDMVPLKHARGARSRRSCGFWCGDTAHAGAGTFCMFQCELASTGGLGHVRQTWTTIPSVRRRRVPHGWLTNAMYTNR